MFAHEMIYIIIYYYYCNNKKNDENIAKEMNTDDLIYFSCFHANYRLRASSEECKGIG